jgi:hypothetical protein
MKIPTRNLTATRYSGMKLGDEGEATFQVAINIQKSGENKFRTFHK